MLNNLKQKMLKNKYGKFNIPIKAKTFNISKEDKYLYSKQELEYINKLRGINLKKYLKKLDDKNYIYIDDEWCIKIV